MIGWCAPSETFYAGAKEAYLLTDNYKAPYYHAWAKILLHFAQAMQQPDTQNLTQLRQAINAFADTGAHIRLPVYYSMLTLACLKAAQFETGQEALELTLAESQKNDEHWWDSEIYRLRGELLRAQGANPGDVEAMFQRALKIAQKQQSKSLELRAAISMAMLWQVTSRLVEAKQLLTPLYTWFTEGLDTPDLQTAQALIAKL